MSASWRQDSNSPIVFRTPTHIPRMLFMFYEDTSKPLKEKHHYVYIRTGAMTRLCVTGGRENALNKKSQSFTPSAFL
jgi:hypothetical protein